MASGIGRDFNRPSASRVTHATVSAATLALLLFAGEVIRPFAWVMLFGVITGTFSSIYVASAILIWIDKKYPRANSAVTSSSPARPARPEGRPSTAARAG